MLRRRAFTMLLALLVTLGVVQPAAADSPSPSTAPVVRFLSYNICGNSIETRDCSLTREVTERREKVVAEARAWKADLVFLQEVCRQQYDAVAGALAADGYTGYFVSTLDKRPGLCLMGGVTGDYGIAVFAKGAITGGTGVPINPDDGYTSTYSGPEKWYAACVEARIQFIKTRACSVHLFPQYAKDSQGNPIPQDINARQAKNLAAHPWLNAGTPVVLGGDFNPVNRNGGGRAQSPRSSDLDPFYRPALGGTGRFIEADETDSDYFDAGCKTDPLPVSCRSGEFTHRSWSAGTEAKLDYIFVDAARFKNVVADPQLRDSRISDHYPYRGAATFSHCNGEADGKADMLRRDASGDLWRHFGRADGSLAADPCKVGAGWSIMNRIVRAGDVDKDGDEDLYGIDGAGDLYFYPGDPTELFFAAPRKVGSGWGAVDTLVANPDMDGDANPDLIARFTDGKVYRVPTKPDGFPHPKVEIAAGWQIYDTVLAPGNIGGDSSPDVLARNSAGELFLHTGKPDGTLNGPAKIGWGWNIYNTVLAPGDVNGDGKPDLLARKPSGDLYLYAGTGDATEPFINPTSDADRAGWGFPAGDLIF
ncbi:endonuclease [Streptomyces sp. ms191]|uniref:endonuclease/exonuclease/phosphatase family protein n=1 Tax=Streptomyces sp. ms191 TaxID=1827978 RepID=UPI0011CE0FEC|nr:endonuclease/exonuclease/phosphatase family protein [Streptomyces sp. ms191]TXS20109.1 endonuclease [Streptomyces sp. ms191]